MREGEGGKEEVGGEVRAWWGGGGGLVIALWEVVDLDRKEDAIVSKKPRAHFFPLDPVTV